MTIHTSLKVKSTLMRTRSVWTRSERLAKLEELGKRNPADPVFGLPKVRTQFKVKTRKAKAAEPAAEAVAAVAAAPAADAAAKPAAKGAGASDKTAGAKPATKAAAPAKGPAAKAPGKKG